MRKIRVSFGDLDVGRELEFKGMRGFKSDENCAELREPREGEGPDNRDRNEGWVKRPIPRFTKVVVTAD